MPPLLALASAVLSSPKSSATTPLLSSVSLPAWQMHPKVEGSYAYADYTANEAAARGNQEAQCAAIKKGEMPIEK
jgi:hypothetical protein